MIKYDLGGVGKGVDGYITVNLGVEADITADIMDLDSFCEDNSVDEFYLSHTLEHIPVIYYKKFISDLIRKLKVGGCIRVVQTDTGEVVKMWARGELLFRSARTALFTPANRCIDNMLQQHQNMWTAEELCKDFEFFGMKAETFDAGGWSFDMQDDLYTNITECDYGKTIPNLGVLATKI